MCEFREIEEVRPWNVWGVGFICPCGLSVQPKSSTVASNIVNSVQVFISGHMLQSQENPGEYNRP